MSRLARRFVASLSLALVALLAVPAVASAHGGPGVIEVDEPEARGDLTIGLRIRITYEGDGHTPDAADVGEISVEGTGPGGATVGPETGFEATEVPGVYAIELTFPEAGSWDLTITSEEPAATQSTTVEVGAPDSGTSDGSDDEPVTDGTPGDGASDDGASDDGASGDAGSDDAGDADAVVTADGAEIVERGSGGDGPTPLLVTLLVAAVLVVAGIVGAIALRRRSRDA